MGTTVKLDKETDWVFSIDRSRTGHQYKSPIGLREW